MMVTTIKKKKSKKTIAKEFKAEQEAAAKITFSLTQAMYGRCVEAGEVVDANNDFLLKDPIGKVLLKMESILNDLYDSRSKARKMSLNDQQHDCLTYLSLLPNKKAALSIIGNLNLVIAAMNTEGVDVNDHEYKTAVSKACSDALQMLVTAFQVNQEEYGVAVNSIMNAIEEKKV